MTRITVTAEFGYLRDQRTKSARTVHPMEREDHRTISRTVRMPGSSRTVTKTGNSFLPAPEPAQGESQLRQCGRVPGIKARCLPEPVFCFRVAPEVCKSDGLVRHDHGDLRVHREVLFTGLYRLFIVTGFCEGNGHVAECFWVFPTDPYPLTRSRVP
jgi:hypothetical protein